MSRRSAAQSEKLADMTVLMMSATKVRVVASVVVLLAGFDAVDRVDAAAAAVAAAVAAACPHHVT